MLASPNYWEEVEREQTSLLWSVVKTLSEQTAENVLVSCHLFSGDFLKTLEDPDLNVRRVALVTFNSAAHNKPSLIRELLDSVLPQLYNETKVRKELIREVRRAGTWRHGGSPSHRRVLHCVCVCMCV